MLPWKLRKCRILPVNQNLSLIYFPLAKFQLVSCNPSLAISWQMTYTQKLPKLCSATLREAMRSTRGDDFYRRQCFYLMRSIYRRPKLKMWIIRGNIAKKIQGKNMRVCRGYLRNALFIYLNHFHHIVRDTQQSAVSLHPAKERLVIPNSFRTVFYFTQKPDK